MSSIKRILERCNEQSCDTVFMTPNMLNTYVADDTNESIKEYAAKTAEMQNSGRMDKYIYSAIEEADNLGITICDCYSK